VTYPHHQNSWQYWVKHVNKISLSLSLFLSMVEIASDFLNTVVSENSSVKKEVVSELVQHKKWTALQITIRVTKLV
jgi:hypothetical protein